ncbi:MAG TPA: VOC family protein [Steroidobacteraceae bacterium]|nr:VOC family protein [Steroidobacteraceae bacterium]
MAGLAVEVDHVFVCTPADAPEAQRLLDLGLLEGSRNHHPGQGTANRRFFFANAMLELLWVEDAAEAQSDAQPARRMHLWERWSGRDSGACPFGVCLRPTAGHASKAQGAAPPFPFWDYRPAYSPVGMPVADNSTVDSEPLMFYMPVHRRMDLAPVEQRQPYQHVLPIRELTSTRIFAPGADSPSAPMRAALSTGAFSFQHSAQPLLELGFDGEQQGKRVDLRPSLPLVLLW